MDIEKLKLKLMNSQRVVRGLVSAAIFGAIGLVVMQSGSAATFAANQEAESGVVAGNASVTSDASASVGQAVRFGDAGGSLSYPRIPWEGGPNYYKQFAKADASGWDDPTFFPISVFLGSADPYIVSELKDAGVNTYLAVQHHPSIFPISNITSQGLFAIPHVEPEDWNAGSWTSADVGNDPGVVGWFATDECEMGYSGCDVHTLTAAQCDTAFNTNDTDKTRLYADRNDCKAMAAKNAAECGPPDPAKYNGVYECHQWVYQKHVVDLLRAKNDGRMVSANFGNGIIRMHSSPNTLDSHFNAMDITAVDKYAYTSVSVSQLFTGDPPSGFLGSFDWPEGALAHRSATYGFMADQFKRVQNPASRKPIGVMVETGQPYIEDNDCRFDPCNIRPELMEGAVWSAIIHEARHISYFAFDNSPACGEIWGCPVVHDKVKAVNAKLKSLAPVLNTQSYYNQTYSNNGTTFHRYSFGNGTDAMLKTYGGSAYIFAGIGVDITGQRSGSENCKLIDGKIACRNIGVNHATGTKTFTLPDGVNGTSVEVVGENRTIPVSNRTFSDSFPNEYTHHVYKIAL